MIRRELRFIIIGIVGFLAQTGTLAALTSVAHWPVAPATAAAVELAVLMNFVCHERWTWRDRSADTAARWERLAKFHATNGLMSLTAGVFLTWLAVHLLSLPAVVANTGSVLTVAALNYRAADRYVFRAAAMACVLLTAPGVFAAELKPETVDAWNRHVAMIERSLDEDVNAPMALEPTGRTFDIPSGTISEWRGSVLVPNHTVGEVVDLLVGSPTLPMPPEVVSARVVSRRGDALHTYMRLVRHALVTATYDTEHDVCYVRQSASLATSRSISTTIAEVGGDDRGFMWRLNSYWRYQQVGRDVRIDMLSLTLSRGTPWILKPVASPIVERIGRESVLSTLNAVVAFINAAPAPRVSAR